jgi:metal-dependent hydrolase (beta-lactamase superfamily II)
MSTLIKDMKENFDLGKELILAQNWKDLGINKESFEACI